MDKWTCALFVNYYAYCLNTKKTKAESGSPHTRTKKG
jgi:hypothetical protein